MDATAHLERLQQRGTNRSCLTSGRKPVKGRWADVGSEEPPILMLHVMSLLSSGEPVAWLRWADGDIYDFSPSSSRAGAPIAEAMLAAAADWPQQRHLFVAANTQHVCMLAGVWNAFVSAAGLHQYVFLDYFYLPSIGSDAWRRLGVRGWLEETRHRRRVVVGPPSLRATAACLGARFVEVRAGDRAERLEQLIADEGAATREPVLFLLCAGSLAKLAISRAFARPRNKDSFVDIGTCLFKNGVAAQASQWAARGDAERCPLTRFVPDPG